MRITVLISLLFLSISKAPYHKIHIDRPKVVTLTDTSKYTIIKFDKKNDYPFDRRDQPAILSIEEINQIDKLLIRAVSKKNKEYRESLHIKSSEYYKQLIAVTNQKGEKEVWANCFCSIEHEPNWKTNIILMLDGGFCYFNLKINLTKNTYYDFIVNNFE